MSTFESLQLDPQLMAAVSKMNFTTPTEIQTLAIPLALQGTDFIATAQTGSGKTLAYALAVMTQLMKNPKARAVILSPSRETAEQVFKVFEELCADIPMTLGSAITGLPVAVQIKALKKNPRIIVGTPGRLNEHLRGNKLLLQGLTMLVIDEADRMLDLGFEDQLQFMKSTLRGERQTLMFAASFGSWAEPIARLFMKSDYVQVKASAAGMPVATLKQRVYFMNKSQKENRLRDELRKMKGGVIIFADSQESCVALGRFLEHHEFSCEFVHGKMTAGHRNRVLREFREGQIQIMVTTDLLARGLDVPTIQHVISYDLPYRGEEFLHRIGRTARAGRDGEALTFVTPADGRTYRYLKQYLVDAEQEHLISDFQFTDR